jgi:nicotinate-nucleotide adenylyltransferase
MTNPYCGRDMRRAILGGTFDPPHIAHLLAGEAAYRQLGVDVVTFLPAGAPWQKAGNGVTAPEHRWAMTQLAVDGVDYFEADDRELRRSGWTYTIETLDSFARDDVVLVLGADTAANLPTWHRADEVRERSAIAVAPRPGHDRALVDSALEGRVEWLDMPEVAVSGTEIRDRLARGKSVRFLVRESVWDYLVERNIYERTV